MMRALCLQAPSFDGFDGGAGSRYQARREIRSYWYPTWLAQRPAGLPWGHAVVHRDRPRCDWASGSRTGRLTGVRRVA